MATLTREKGRTKIRILTEPEIATLIKEYEEDLAKQEAAKKEKEKERKAESK